MDQFALEAVDLGRLYKLRVRHDNSGLTNASWYLDRIEVKQVGGGRGQTVAAGSDVAVFHAERWLSKDKSKNTAQKTHCNLYAKVSSRKFFKIVYFQFSNLVVCVAKLSTFQIIRR